MNARKLPSGRWQSIVYIGKEDGKKKYVTITEGTRKECLIRAAAALEEARQKKNPDNMITVEKAVARYIDSRRGTLSPSTIAGYLKLKELYITPAPIAQCYVSDLSDEKIQTWVSSLTISKKTIKNAYGLLRPAVKMFRSNVQFNVEFPKGKKYKGYVPSTDEVLKLLAAAKKTKPNLYRACLLAAFSTLRRGEIACLTRDDIRGNILRVDKDMIQDEEGKWIIKNLPKEEASVRDVPLPQWVIEEMPEGRLVSYTPQGITREFIATLNKLDIPHFRFHDLRKYSVSLMHHKGVSMASIKQLGGWANMDTPQRIYISSLDDENEREMTAFLEYANSIKV